MESVDKVEVERLKAFMGLGDYQTQTFVQQSSVTNSLRDLESVGHQSTLASQKGEPAVATVTNAMDLREEGQTKGVEVDWQKVGKVYNKKTQLDEVFNREFNRLKVAIDEKLVLQDEQLLQDLHNPPVVKGVAGKK